MVRCVVKRSFPAASCCKVDVVKGARGWRLRSRLLTSDTVSWPCAAVSNLVLAAVASASVLISNCFSALPSSVCSLALKGCDDFSTLAVSVQYSTGIKASISSSRSAIRRNAGLCTRPADKPYLIFFHNKGERLKPTR